MSQDPVVIVRCDASAQLGFGHVIRCLAIADAFAESRWRPVFAMSDHPEGTAVVRERGHQLHIAGLSSDEARREADWIRSLVADTAARAVVLDVRTAMGPDDVRSIRNAKVTVATIDDGSPRRLAADLAFFPPVPQLEDMNWDGFTGRTFAGWEWIPLRPEVARARDRVAGQRGASRQGPPAIVVAMGGSDPTGLTLLALRALEQLDEDASVTIVIGRAFAWDAELARALDATRRRYTVLRNPDLVDVAAGADLAVLAFGMTAYEVAALGVPAIHLPRDEDHARSASALSDAGMSVCLGLSGTLAPADLSRAVRRLLSDAPARARMSDAGWAMIDGLGAGRIARMIDETTRSN